MIVETVAHIFAGHQEPDLPKVCDIEVSPSALVLDTSFRRSRYIFQQLSFGCHQAGAMCIGA